MSMCAFNKYFGGANTSADFHVVEKKKSHSLLIAPLTIVYTLHTFYVYNAYYFFCFLYQQFNVMFSPDQMT